MAFDVEKLFEFSVKAIHDFSLSHKDEMFYAFAIDASLLCLNSEECIKKYLEEYQQGWERKSRPIPNWEDLTEIDLADVDYLLDLKERHSNLDRNDKVACLRVINEKRADIREKGNPYNCKEEMLELRENTGDWQYQGFAEIDESVGFDSNAYNVHYDLADEEQLHSEYGIAMDKLVEMLKDSDAFQCLNTTDDFYITRVEHNY